MRLYRRQRGRGVTPPDPGGEWRLLGRARQLDWYPEASNCSDDRCATVRVAARRPGDVRIRTQSANAPEIIQADLLDEVSVGSAVAGADAVFNLVGILAETGPQTYRTIHVEGARRVALAAKRYGVMGLIHLSALGASLTLPAISDQTKAAGAAS
jgi:NADH dehydrogenase